MNIIVLGTPASGKGAQAELLAKKLDFRHVEIGDVLREVAKKKTPQGKKINRIMHQRGTLVPDEIMRKIVKGLLDETKIKKGVVFDGYPRKLSQYRDLEKMLTKRGKRIDKVIFLKVSKKIATGRIKSRRVCPKCDQEYNLVTRPPKKDELCNQCQIKLVQRQDDRPEVVKKRFEVYLQLTKPLVKYVRKQGIFMTIDGERSIREIHQDILTRLKK